MITEDKVVEDNHGVFLIDRVLRIDCVKKEIELRGITKPQAKILFKEARMISDRLRCFSISHIPDYLSSCIITIKGITYTGYEPELRGGWIDTTGREYEEEI